VVEVPAGKVMVHTVDYFRSFVDDPYVFGQIAANHALGDVFAMGAEPQSALAVATIPFGPEGKVEDTLRDLMKGAMDVLAEAGASLVGGHTSEGAELALGFSVNGLADRGELMRKQGLAPGDALILTKPLGTGTLFAADMQNKARGRWISAALDHMVQSNQKAAGCLRRHGAKACTDVTGFGLLGHLVEMARPSEVDVEVALDALPVMDGAVECIEGGIFSSLQPQNVRLRRAIRHGPDSGEGNGAANGSGEGSGNGSGDDDPRFALLFDPQTAGGLLAGVPAANAEACVAELKEFGYEAAAVIGRVLEQSDALEPVTVV
jgi:selenide,water dikinase